VATSMTHVISSETNHQIEVFASDGDFDARISTIGFVHLKKWLRKANAFAS
jgi:hypothetical protein